MLLPLSHLVFTPKWQKTAISISIVFSTTKRTLQYSRGFVGSVFGDLFNTLIPKIAALGALLL